MFFPFFFFFLFFWKILIFWIHRGGKGQKTVQNNKKIMSVVLHISGTIYHMTVIYICKMIISSSAFSIFFLILIFWVHREVKGQKMAKNDNKFCLSLCISGTVHQMIVIFGAHV